MMNYNFDKLCCLLLHLLLRYSFTQYLVGKLRDIGILNKKWNTVEYQLKNLSSLCKLWYPLLFYCFYGGSVRGFLKGGGAGFCFWFRLRFRFNKGGTTGFSGFAVIVIFIEVLFLIIECFFHILNHLV